MCAERSRNERQKQNVRIKHSHSGVKRKRDEKKSQTNKREIVCKSIEKCTKHTRLHTNTKQNKAARTKIMIFFDGQTNEINGLALSSSSSSCRTDSIE